MAKNIRLGESGQGIFAEMGRTVVSDKYDRVEVGRRIKRLRQSQELTVQELARRSNVSAGYISEVERGLSAVSIDKLTQIAGGLGCTIEVLLGDTRRDPTDADVVRIPAALSAAAEQLNLSHRATLTLLQGKMSLTARRSQSDEAEWDVDEWMRFYHQVKDYLPPC